jgi:hypothetical protein
MRSGGDGGAKGFGENLSAAERRVDPFAGERVEEVGGVADECRARRPGATSL